MKRPFVLIAFLFIAAAIVRSQTSDAKLKFQEKFVLPDSAVAAGIDGEMRVSFDIDKSGSVKKVHIWSGPAWPCGQNPKQEIKAVREAVRNHVAMMKFEPAIKDGRPAEASGALDFKIGDAFTETTEEEARTTGKKRKIDNGPLRNYAIDIPVPAYPLHEKYGPSGTVRVRVVIDEGGTVLLAGAESGNSIFHDAARTSACKAKFKPILENGTPIRFTGFIVYEFTPPGLRNKDFYPPQ